MRIRETVRMLFVQHFSSRPFSQLCNCRHGMPQFQLQLQHLKVQAGGLRFLRGAAAYEHSNATGNGESNMEERGLSSLQKELDQLEIVPKSYDLRGEHQRLLCPKCGGGSSKERSFSLLIFPKGESAFWKCWRAKCNYTGWTGRIKDTSMPVHSSQLLDTADSEKVVLNAEVKAIKILNEKNLELDQVSEEISEYFSERQISRGTLQRNGVMQTIRNNQIVIAFTYRVNNEIVNCNYRNAQEQCWQENIGEVIPYGMDDINGKRNIIIVEGEIDKLSIEEAGYKNCISVPSIQEDRKYDYLRRFHEYFEKAKCIILATNADEHGQALAEEIARRLGREKCWRVTWPRIMGGKSCKDANEVLTHIGPQGLKEVIDGCEPYPIRGLYKFSDYFDEIDAYYQCRLGDELGVSTGWAGLEELYRVVPGELTIVSGVPNSGKSEWIDALLCNLNHREGWRFALCSMENKVREHARKLIEKHIKKPFFAAKYGNNVPRMSVDELEQAKLWLNESFYLIRCEDDGLPSIKWVLNLSKAAVSRHGIRGLVIDPYNELDHQRPPNQTETEYVSQMLTMVKRFAQHHRCHVWFVAHPRQLHNWNGGPPGLYDISGSAHFINKCDNGIVIHRKNKSKDDPIDKVQVLVMKVRNKLAGNIGNADLLYDRITGEFKDVIK